MELHQYLSIVRRHWRSVIATLLICVVVAAAITFAQKPVYTASSALFLTVESGDSAGELSQGATYAERQVESFVSVATTSVVLTPVIEYLSLDLTPLQLADKLAVTSPTATSLIDVSATDGDPMQAARVADAVAISLARAVDQLSPNDGSGTGLVAASVIDPAVAPTTPTTPRPAVNLALGMVFGLLLGVGQAVFRTVLDTRVRTASDLEALTASPILGSIGHVKDSSTHGVEVGDSRWVNAEAYRRLRTNVGFIGLGGERRPSMVITSAVAGEGKTQTVVNLARALAQAGESVLVVDADLRRPQVAERMGVDNEFGLTDVLTGREKLEEMVIDVHPGTLAVLPSGTVPPNPSELLGSEAMAKVLTTVERQYDHVLFDVPPLLPVTDAVVLAGQTAGAVMVARSGMVKQPEFEQARKLLEAGSVTLLGVVLNDVPTTGDGYFTNYYAEYASATTTQPAPGSRARACEGRTAATATQPVLEPQP